VWRNGTPEEEVPIDKDECVAGLDGEINTHVKCYGCHLWGHIKMKQGVWNCPSCEDEWGTGAGGAAPTGAPKVVVEQITPVPSAIGIDVNAMFDAMAMMDGEEDDGAAAVMRQTYLQKREENVVAAARNQMIRLVRQPDQAHLPCVIQATMGLSPAGQNFLVQISKGAHRGEGFETVDDDGGSPVSLISPQKANQLVQLNLARPLPGKSLYDHFSSVVSASGHDLGYTGDLEVTLHPVDATGTPSVQAFTVKVHIVSKYDGRGLLIGTQQHMRWQIVTSYKTGSKTITAEDGTEVTFPFSVKTDGTPIGPVKVLTGKTAPPKEKEVAAAPAAGPLPDANATLSACIAEATQAMAKGVAGAYGGAMMESTPDVIMEGSKEDLDRLATLTEEIQREAKATAHGAPAREPPAAEPTPHVKKKTAPTRPRNHVRQAASLLASFALLSAAVWSATIATVAVSEGMVHAGTHFRGIMRRCKIRATTATTPKLRRKCHRPRPRTRMRQCCGPSTYTATAPAALGWNRRSARGQNGVVTSPPTSMAVPKNLSPWTRWRRQ
jgi:ribosomal protein L37AE/L43A